MLKVIKTFSTGGRFFKCTSKELRLEKASDYKEKDIIHCNKYYIHIEYKQFNTPSLCSWIEDENFKSIDCTPGSSRGFTQYYIDDFKSR